MLTIGRSEYKISRRFWFVANLQQFVTKRDTPFSHIMQLIWHTLSFYTATVNIPSETLIDGNLTDSQVVRYALTIPYLGVTVHVCALQGVIQLYVSTTFPNPNSALYDFTLTLDCSIMCQDNSTCDDLYIPGSEFMHKKSKLSLHQRVRSVEFQSKRDNFVYISVRGALAVTNSFTLNLTEGDIPGDCVGEMVATDCGDTTVSPSPTTTSTVTLPPTSKSI